MGAMLIVDRSLPDVGAALAVLDRQCGNRSARLATDNHDIHVWGATSQPEPIVVGDEYLGVAIAGTLFYADRFGVDAAALIRDDLAVERFDGSQLRGTYVLAVVRDGKLVLELDRVGSFACYRNAAGTVWSSSFLAVCALGSTLTFSTQAAYEYLFQGTCYGTATPVREVERIGPWCRYAVTAGSETDRPWLLPSEPQPWNFDEALTASLSSLRGVFGCAVNAFGNRINMALTGGYDSRLMLAQLRDLGCTPTLHVYGQDSDDDVIIAKQIAAGQGLQLDHISKERYQQVQPDDPHETVRQNFEFFDGWPVDGIFDSGIDRVTRLKRASNGVLSLNGGAGGMYRNAYYIGDRPLRILDMLRTFYTQLDPAACTANFSLDGYYRGLGAKLVDAQRLAGERMTRVQVELVYPLVRCRFWMGRNTSLNTRIGPTLTPFTDPAIVETAASAPLRHKNFGRLEAAMIEALNPALAAYMSDYGHALSGPPPWRRRLSDLQMHHRPPLLRSVTYRIKHRRRNPPTGQWSLAGLEQFLGGPMEVGRQLLNVEAVRDAGHLKRLATLELLARELHIDPKIDPL